MLANQVFGLEYLLGRNNPTVPFGFVVNAWLQSNKPSQKISLDNSHDYFTFELIFELEFQDMTLFIVQCKFRNATIQGTSQKMDGDNFRVSLIGAFILHFIFASSKSSMHTAASTLSFTDEGKKLENFHFYLFSCNLKAQINFCSNISYHEKFCK